MAITQLTFYPNSINYYGFDPTAEPSVSGNGYVCSGGESTGVAYDLLDNRRSSVITFDTSAETADVTIDIDLTAAITNANFVILDNHNLKTADASLTVTHGTTNIDSPTCYSGLLGSALAADSLGVGIEMVIAHDGMSLFKFTAVSDDNWELLLADVTTFDADITLGEIIIGKSFTPTCNPELNGVDNGGLYGGITLNETKAGIRSVVKQYGERKYWSFPFAYVTTAQLAEFRRIWQETKGYPLYFSTDSDSATLTLYRARIMNNFEPEQIADGAYSLTMELEAEI